jgi:hypothetical protein
MDTTNFGFVEHWRTVGPILQQLETDELRHYTLSDRQRDIAALLETGAQFAVPRHSSGFIEQQRLFMSAVK